MPKFEIGPSVIVLALILASPASAANIVASARASGDFTRLLAANDLAGTTSVLEGKGPFTVFAPNDAAFARVPASKMEALMAPGMRSMLKVTLANHIVSGLLDRSAIEDGLTKADAVVVIAANNMPLIFKHEGGYLTVNGAHIIKGPMIVDNGLVYVVDTVLTPAMPVQPHY